MLAVRQVGWDRVIELVVSGGGGAPTTVAAGVEPDGGQARGEGLSEEGQAKARQRRVFLEFFAGGNIVVTDGELNVVGLLREVREGDEEVDVKIGGKYRVDVKQGYGKEEHPGDGTSGQGVNKDEVRAVLERHVEKMKAQAGKPAVKKKKKDADDLKKVIANQFAQYSAHLLEHVFRLHQFDGTVKPEIVLDDPDTFSKLMECVAAADEIFKSLGQKAVSKGYIIAKLKDGQAPSAVEGDDQHATTRENLLYDDFHPFKPSQFEDRPELHVLELAGFNKTVDEFYSSLESQKLTSRLTEREVTGEAETRLRQSGTREASGCVAEGAGTAYSQSASD